MVIAFLVPIILVLIFVGIIYWLMTSVSVHSYFLNFTYNLNAVNAILYSIMFIVAVAVWFVLQYYVYIGYAWLIRHGIKLFSFFKQEYKMVDAWVEKVLA